ncbi:MAG: histidinol-phosphatase [Bacteroidales bacterium]|nr:histidinol-phosphatase [Bacteroidales bacterium]HOY39655.1 histidinol-phosphatase [Bacteroidales bacterium]HQP04463.1 histidinol-phosphatase [Bacteroidales bacterium]
MFPSNLHTHTDFSDGTHPPEVYINQAIACGLQTYGFSDHAPLTFRNFGWCLKPEKVNAYCNEIKRLKAEYSNHLNILLGFEVDFIPGVSAPSDVEKYKPDFIIGSIHFLKKPNRDYIMEIDGGYENFREGFKYLFADNPKALAEFYFDTVSKMVQAGGFQIIGHVDKIKMYLNRCFPGIYQEPWYKNLENEYAIFLGKSEIIVEINTRSIYKKHFTEPYPSWDMIKTIWEAGGKLTLSGDTHDPHGVSAYFKYCSDVLKKMGITHLQAHNGTSWFDYKL